MVKKLTTWEVFYAVDMTIACALSYLIIDQILVPFVDEPTKLLGGMWAVVATVFVFRESRASALSAGISRLIATCVSFVLCLAYLLVFPFSGFGMAIVIGIGTIVMMLLGRRDDIITTAITTAVVLVVAGISPQEAWLQPFLRLLDTLVGIGVGVLCKWCASYGYYRMAGQPVR